MKVRLKRASPSHHTISAMFQFHEGPIKTLFTTDEQDDVNSFNSMKVRLKPYFGEDIIHIS